MNLKRILLATALTLFTAISVSAQTQKNIVFIVADDMRNWVGYDNGPAITPSLDALASQSQRFRKAYTVATTCLASRTTMMFGLSPNTHGVGVDSTGWNHTSGPPYTTIYNDPNLKTVPEILGENGYYTAVTGKIFHKPEPSRWHESGPGIPWSTILNPFDPGPDGTFFNPIVLGEGEIHPDQVVANWAADFITNYNSQSPFFLAVGFFQPHIPWMAPQWAYDLYPVVTAPVPVPGDLDDEPADAVAVANAGISGPYTQYELIDMAGKADDYTRAYLAAMSHTDAMVGQVISALQSKGIYNNTDIVFVSDHGFHLGEKFHWRKRTFWDQTVNVPLLIKSSHYPVRNNNAEVSTLDIAPTILQLAGISAPVQFEGSTLNNPSPVEIYMNEGRATVSNRFKVIDYQKDVNNCDQDMAIYWLQYDKLETNNIAPGIIAAMGGCSN